VKFVDARVGSWGRTGASAERFKLSWAWVLKCVLSPQRSGMVSREACCHFVTRYSVPGPQPWATLRLLLPLLTLTLRDRMFII